jgi:tetratricopeptide (TPR) repeat protein
MNISKQIYISRLKNHPMECLAEIHKEKADVLKQTGMYDQATISFDKARVLFSKGGNKCKCADIDHAMGDLLVTKGAFQEAEKHLNTAIAIYKEYNREESIAKCYKELGKVFQYREEPDVALLYYDRAMKLYELNHDEHGQHIIMEYSADIYRTKGEYAKALDIVNQLEKINIGSDDTRTLCRINKLAGKIYMEQGEGDVAKTLLNRAYQYTKTTGENSMALYILCDLGLTCFNQADYINACGYFEECLVLAEKLDSVYMKIVNMVNLADALLQAGDLERSQGYISRAATINHNIGGLNSEIERIQKEIAEKEGGKKETSKEKSY